MGPGIVHAGSLRRSHRIPNYLVPNALHVHRIWLGGWCNSKNKVGGETGGV